MAYYPENTKGIIQAINACILAQGGVVVAYPHNTGGIIDALRTLASLMGGGSDLSIEMTAGEA